MAFPYGGINSISLGTAAGSTSQGSAAIAIGYQAGVISQPASSIIINATGSSLSGVAPNALYIAPIRNLISGTLLMYDTLNKEVVYSSTLNNTFTANNIVALSTLNASTVNFSTLILNTANVSTANVQILNYSSLSGSTIIANTGFINSTLTVSTLIAANINVSSLALDKFSTLTGSSLIASTVAISTITSNTGFINSTLTVSTLIAANINVSSLALDKFSTLTGSSLIASTVAISTITSNTGFINSTLTVSTLIASNINVSSLALDKFSTLTGSSLIASTVAISTITTNTGFINSTLTVSTLTVSTLNASTVNTQFMNYSTLIGSTISSNVGYSNLLLFSSISSINGSSFGNTGPRGETGPPSTWLATGLTGPYNTVITYSQGYVGVGPTGTYLQTTSGGATAGTGSTVPQYPVDVAGTVRNSVNMFGDNSALVTATPALDYTTFGQNWTPTTLPSALWNTVAVSASGQYQSAGGNSTGIRYSNNYGQTWTVATGTSENIISIAISASGQYQLAATFGSGIYYSNNYGVSWTPSTGAPSSLWHEICISSSGQYASACINNSFTSTVPYYSTNYGQTWVASTAPQASYSAIACSASGQYQVAGIITGFGNGGIYYSFNYGQNWTVSDTTNMTGILPQGAAMSASGQYASIITPSNGVYISSNYGLKWTQINLPVTNSLNLRRVSVSASGQYQVTTAGGVGLYYSTNYGATWVQGSSLALNWLGVGMSANGQYCLACVPGGVVYQSITRSPPLQIASQSTTTSTALTLVAPNITTTNNVGIVLGQSVTLNNYATIGFQYVEAGYATNYLYLSVSTSQTLCITAGGNVGIGTTNPSTKLHIYSANNCITASWDIARANANDYVTAGIESYFITRDGYQNLGAFIRLFDVNTNSNYPTTLRGGVISFGTIDGTTAGQGVANPAVERMRILASGNVGIGTNNPGAKLDVNGAINALNLNVFNAANPVLIVATSNSVSGNYFAQATNNGAFINDAAVNDLCINSRTGNIRFAANGFASTGLIISSSYLQTPYTLRLNGISEFGQIHLNFGSYNAIIRQDGGSIFLPLIGTAPNGQWNTLRPLFINLSNGLLQSENGQSFAGGTTITGALSCTTINTNNSNITVGTGNVSANRITVNSSNIINVYSFYNSNILGNTSSSWAGTSFENSRNIADRVITIDRQSKFILNGSCTCYYDGVHPSRFDITFWLYNHNNSTYYILAQGFLFLQAPSVHLTVSVLNNSLQSVPAGTYSITMNTYGFYNSDSADGVTFTVMWYPL